jgi:hypothetical protein
VGPGPLTESGWNAWLTLSISPAVPAAPQAWRQARRVLNGQPHKRRSFWLRRGSVARSPSRRDHVRISRVWRRLLDRRIHLFRMDDAVRPGSAFRLSSGPAQSRSGPPSFLVRRINLRTVPWAKSGHPETRSPSAGSLRQSLVGRPLRRTSDARLFKSGQGASRRTFPAIRSIPRSSAEARSRTYDTRRARTGGARRDN